MLNVYEQIFTEDDALAAYNAVKSGILSSFGPCVSELENNFASFTNRRYAISGSNGTAGLLLALVGLEIENCRVAVPACTFAAVGFAPLERNNRLEFIDVDRDTWNLDLNELETKCKHWLNIDPIKCVIAVHNYGNPYDYSKLHSLADTYGFKIIEDACEALCAEFDGVKAGNLGDVSVFSFYGNKLCASGEGCMVLTDDPKIAERIKLYRGQGQDPNKRFWHITRGFNYRLTNLQAAVVLSQFKRIDHTQTKKLQIQQEYAKHLPSHARFQYVNPEAKHAWWMVSIISDKFEYEHMKHILTANDIETRPIFYPLPYMPPFGAVSVGFENSVYLNRYGITLPSGPGTQLEDIKRICDLIR